MFGGISDGGSTGAVGEGVGSATLVASCALAAGAGVLSALGDCADNNVAHPIANKLTRRHREAFIFLRRENPSG